MTPEQIARISLDIGREVTELVQRRLAEAVKRGPSAERNMFAERPVHEDEAPIGSFAGFDVHKLYELARDASDTDGGVAADARRVVRGQPPQQRTPEEDDGA